MIVRFFDWDQLKNVSCSIKNVKNKNKVVVQHEWGLFLADVLLVNKTIEKEDISGEVVRVADSHDLKVSEENEKKENEIRIYAKQESRELEVPMKVIDAKMSIDCSCVVVAFVADGRVDFRELVKRISAKFGKSIRLQQIGSRDEARRCGGYGICGRELCCRKFPGSLTSISTDMARCQLVSHRGSERISGLCGRLMCCLSFESEQYQEMLKGMPERGEIVKIGAKKGEVVDLQILENKVRVRLEDGTFVTVDKKEIRR